MNNTIEQTEDVVKEDSKVSNKLTENVTNVVAKASLRNLPGRLWWILIVVMLADLLDLLDSAITNIGAPTIAREIGGGESLIKWLGTSYALAMGVLLVVGGRLGDKFGKRNMFL